MVAGHSVSTTTSPPGYSLVTSVSQYTLPNKDIDNFYKVAICYTSANQPVTNQPRVHCATVGLRESNFQPLEYFVEYVIECYRTRPPIISRCDTADEQHFDKIEHNKHHLLHYILPAPSAASQCYNLRRRPHTQLLPQHRGHLMDSNFITRMLYKNIYWRYYETINPYTEPRTNWYYTSSFIMLTILRFVKHGH